MEMEEGAFEVTTKGTGKAGWTGFQKVPVGTERQMYPVTLFFLSLREQPEAALFLLGMQLLLGVSLSNDRGDSKSQAPSPHSVASCCFQGDSGD